MPFTTLAGIPGSFTSGESIVWTDTLPDYPTGTYTVAYNFAAHWTPVDGYESFTVSGTGVGTVWTFTMPTSTPPKAGKYAWQKLVTRVSDSLKAQLTSGVITVIPNLSTAPTTSTAATQLAAIQTAITTLTSGSAQSVSFNGQSFTKKDLSKLLDDRTRLEAQVIRENRLLAALAGNPYDTNIETQFTRP